jgi:hypothetical protein
MRATFAALENIVDVQTWEMQQSKTNDNDGPKYVC